MKSAVARCLPPIHSFLLDLATEDKQGGSADPPRGCDGYALMFANITDFVDILDFDLMLMILSLMRLARSLRSATAYHASDCGNLCCGLAAPVWCYY